MKLFEDDLGNVSAMRLIAVIGAMAGVIAFGASVVAMFMKYDAAVGMAAIAAGLVTTAMCLKWAQKTVETK